MQNVEILGKDNTVITGTHACALIRENIEEQRKKEGSPYNIKMRLGKKLPAHIRDKIINLCNTSE